MKTSVKPLCLTLALLSPAAVVSGQTLTPLVNFNVGDGANPQASLVASGNTLYGTTYAGGNSNFGTVFAVNTDGSGFSNLYSFNGTIYSTNTGTYGTTDGANPAGGLVLSGNTLYGTTSAGGSADAGTVFAVNTNGGYSNLFSFNGGSQGADPEAGLVLMSNTLYGTTFIGGTSGAGSVFRVNTNGSAFTNIYSFSGGTDGSNPEAGLLLAGYTLYGTANGGGRFGNGSVFRVNIDSSGFSNIYSFTGGSDGANPEGGLVLSGVTLYGTTYTGGTYKNGNGTVFAVNTNGSGFQSYPFNGSNGANPQAGLVLLGNTLYGTAANGGSAGWGTIFQINTDGSDFTNLYAFQDGSDGAVPEAGLLVLGNTFYGTTQADDGYGEGTVFALNEPGLGIPLTYAVNGNQLTLSWSSPAFFLQVATSVTGTYNNVGAPSPYSIALVPGKQRFFRLQEY